MILPEKNNSQKGYRMTIFCQDKDPHHEKWEGTRYKSLPNRRSHSYYTPRRTGVDKSVSIFGADDVRKLVPATFVPLLNHTFTSQGHDIKHFTHVLKSLTAAYTNIYTDVPSSSSSSQKRRRSIFSHLSSPIKTPAKSDYDALVATLSSSRQKSLATELWKLRRIKSPAEQALMRRASDISGTAMAKVRGFGNTGAE